MQKRGIQIIISCIILMTIHMSCNHQPKNSSQQATKNDTFQYFVEQFADIKILRYKVPGFDSLDLQQKKLAYYLSEASRCGRDILYDQFYEHNLEIRRTLEAIYKGYEGDRNTQQFNQFMTYLKRVWFSNGIHHHYSSDKILPEFDPDYFNHLISNTPDSLFSIPQNEPLSEFTERLKPLIFDPAIASKKVNKNPDKDLLKASAINFYKNVTEEEATNFYKEQKDPNDETPVEYGHNTQLVKRGGKLTENVWKADGMYGEAIEQIIYWLKKAKEVAVREQQEKALQLLIEFYQTGNLETWDQFNIAWVKDTLSNIDFINGFIEVYNDPLNLKGTWEALVEMTDSEATERMHTLSNHAQWFEKHSPVADRFKKEDVKGITGKVINVVQLGGDVYPYSPIGINLPNSGWIRQKHGSKSVTLDNIVNAHHQSSLESGMLEEFAYSDKEISLAHQYGLQAHNLHVDMHEVLGHGSGKYLEGVSADSLKNYHSTIEEARADLFALYYLMDPKLIDLGLMPHMDVAKAGYNSFVRNGFITQLTRIEPGKDLEEAHMRNRQLICQWVYEKGQSEQVITKEINNNKTYFVINNYPKLRDLFGELLAEVQRIKSEGDYQAAHQLIQNYGVKINDTLHREVLSRYKKLELAPYTGFLNPILEPVTKNGQIKDVKIKYEDSFAEQMMYYSTHYSFLTY